MKDKVERTFVLIKPDGIKKSLTGNIITILSETKLKIVGAKIVKVTPEFAKQHYSELHQNLIVKFGEKEGNEVFDNVIDYIQGKFHTDRVMALVYAGPNAIEKVREIAGATDPEKAPHISIRGKYGRIHSNEEVVDYEDRFNPEDNSKK